MFHDYNGVHNNKLIKQHNLEYLCLLGMVSFEHHTSYMWMGIECGFLFALHGLISCCTHLSIGDSMHWVFESLKLLLLLNMIIFFVVSEWVKPPMENEQSFKNIT